MVNVEARAAVFSHEGNNPFANIARVAHQPLLRGERGVRMVLAIVAEGLGECVEKGVMIIWQFNDLEGEGGGRELACWELGEWRSLGWPLTQLSRWRGGNWRVSSWRGRCLVLGRRGSALSSDGWNGSDDGFVIIADGNGAGIVGTRGEIYFFTVRRRARIRFDVAVEQD
jgi:hypothetical protein